MQREAAGDPIARRSREGKGGLQLRGQTEREAEADQGAVMSRKRGLGREKSWWQGGGNCRRTVENGGLESLQARAPQGLEMAGMMAGAPGC